MLLALLALAAPAHAAPLAADDAAAIEAIIKNNFQVETDSSGRLRGPTRLGWQSGNESTWVRGITLNGGGDHITGLTISYNGLKGALSVENLSQLTSLDASYNQLTAIGALNGLTALQSLNLSNNNISTISGLENLAALRSLYLDNNQISKIEGLDALVNLNTLNLDGNNLPLSELAVAMQYAQNYYLGHHGIMQTTAKPFMDSVQKLYLGHSSYMPGQQQTSHNPTMLAAGESGGDMPLYPQANPWRMNFTPLSGWGQNKGADGIQGYDVSRYGGLLTLDHTWNDFMLGTAFTFAKTKLDYDNWGSETSADSMAIALYGRHNFGQWFVGGQAGLGMAMVDNHRGIPAIGVTAKSDYDLFWYQASAAAGYDFKVGENAMVSPSLGFAYLGSSSQGFTEKGAGNLNLDVDSQTMNGFEARAMVEAQTSIATTGGMRVTPRVKLGLAYELADENAGIHTRFSEISEIGAFEAESADVGRLRFIGGLGVDLSLNDDVSFGIDYETSIQQD